MARSKKATIPAAVRRKVAERYGGFRGCDIPAKCAYCPKRGRIVWFQQGNKKTSFGWVGFQDLELDHVHSEFSGGETSADNIVLACQRCNRSKGHTPLETWRRTA